MKHVASALAVAAALAVALPARAEERMVGVVTRIDLGPASAIVTVRDASSGTPIDVRIEDEPTVAKLKDGRIAVGDEVRCQYEKRAGENVAISFRKAKRCTRRRRHQRR